MKAVYHFLKSNVVLVYLKNQSKRWKRGKKVQLGKLFTLEDFNDEENHQELEPTP